MFRNRSASSHSFAMVPRADIPRAGIKMEKTWKGTAAASSLCPFLVEEVLPGDTFSLNATIFARMATPLFPVMDNSWIETFFFFVPNRLVWSNWQRFCGEQDNPDDSIDFTIPQIVSDVGGAIDGTDFQQTLWNFFGLPCSGQVEAASTISVSALPFRGYNLIWNEWFRDQNLQESAVVDIDDGPDDFADYPLKARNKKHDYFTGALPWPVKGGVSVPLPIGGTAPVVTTGEFPLFTNAGATRTASLRFVSGSFAAEYTNSDAQAGSLAFGSETGLEANLEAATAATINQLRQAFQIQRLLERDARGGTRYTELVMSHFGVRSPDSRLQRPEYLGGGKSRISIAPIPQTSATSASGTDTPQGNLAAIGTAVLDRHGFTQSFTEHGYVFGLFNIRNDLTYQQGIRRHWSRLTRYDFYWPVFAHLGEQAILSKEIYATGEAADEDVFGYQERWAEYRYLPNEITGAFRSYHPTPLDAWHFAQYFGARPTLEDTFIQDSAGQTTDRALAVTGELAQFLVDAFISVRAARPLPLYSVPGLIDHF